MPALTPLQIRHYLDSWLRATRPAGAPPLIITVDAALIAGHRASGSLDQLNALARQMIIAGGPIITSWDAWTAVDDGHRTTRPAEPPVRPAGWPTPEALRLINHCRVAAGLAQRSPPG